MGRQIRVSGRLAAMPPKSSARKPKPASSKSSNRSGLADRTAAKKSSARRATRNATPPIEAVEPMPAAPIAPAPIARIPRRPLPLNTPAGRRASRNLYSALGGPQPIIEMLRASGKPKATRLADLLTDPTYADDSRFSFSWKLAQVGLNLADFTELMLDVRNAGVLARLLTSSDEVAESIIARATDNFEPHTACRASGRVLVEDEEGNIRATDEECFQCQGSGYMLRSAELEWVELYLELIRLRKNAPLVAMTKNVTNQNLNVHGDLVTGDGAPQIDSIIKKADEQRLLPAPIGTAGSLTDGAGQVPVMVGMPEDSVDENAPVEAEIVKETPS